MRNWFILAGIIILVYFSAYDIIFYFNKSGVLKFYLIALFLLIAFFVAMISILGIEKVHLHHYVFAMVLIFFTCYPEKYIRMLNGIGTGMLLDGGSSFGWDPVFTFDLSKSQILKMNQKEG